MTEMITQLELTVQNQLELIYEMKNIRQEVKDTEARVTDLVERVSKEITINYEEQNQIKSLVFKKSTEFAKAHLKGEEYSDERFKAWKGIFTARLYSRLKSAFNVVRYTALRRECFDNAMDYLEGLEYDHLHHRELKPTFKVLQIEKYEKEKK